LPNPEWGTFPHGKLSHTVQRYFYTGERLGDMTFGDYRRLKAAGRSTAFEGCYHEVADSEEVDHILNQFPVQYHVCHKHPADSTTPIAIDGISDNIGEASLLRDYYDFAFHTNNTTLGDVSYPSSLAVLFFIALVIRAFKRVALPRFSNLGRKLGRSAHGPGWEEQNEERVVKFGEYVYRLLYHSAVSVYGVWYFRNKPWWDRSQGGTLNCFLDYGFQTIEPGMAWYFLVQAAYNVDALVSLLELSFVVECVNPLTYYSSAPAEDLRRKRDTSKHVDASRRRTVLWTPLFQIKWSDTARGDFQEMFAHHLVTNIIIYFCSLGRFTRMGSMVFLVHDLSDVPIDMSKLANFVRWKVTTVTCFAVMCVMWVVCRLYFLPFVICRSVVADAYKAMFTYGPVLDPGTHSAYYALFLLGLGSLILLHVMWFFILLRIGWTLVSKGERHDYSEHRSGESRKDN